MGLFTSLAQAGKSNYPDPDPPQYDLTKTVDFERQGEYYLGPTGARGWMHLRNLMTRRARQILITAVEPGSPAAGVLQDGDVVLGVFGKPFDDDARQQFGEAIDRAETAAGEGKLRLTRWRPTSESPRRGETSEVVVQLPVLGSYADGAPFDCDKSARIYEQALAVMAADKSMGRLKALAFLATGEEQYLTRVRDYLHKQSWASPTYKINVDGGGKMTWSCGFSLLILCEYYLMTGDDYVLPAITEIAVKASMGQSRSGTWGHGFALPRNNGGKLHGDLVGYGALNLPALHVVTGLLLAKQCGVDHPEVDQALDRGLTFFRQFAGHGSISYGQHRPSFEHYAAGKNALGANGKNSLAAIAFALAGDDDSARFFSKLCASSYDTYEYGHGGNSFTVFWRSLGANVGGPASTAAFRKQLRWYNALTRQADGSFVIQPLGGFYGGETLNATAAQVLALSIPKKTLVITGRDDLARVELGEADVEDAVSAGQWRHADYKQWPTAKLLAQLDSFSPSAREWLAKALAKRSDFAIGQLTAMLAADDANRRAGAAAALGLQGARATEAVPALLAALEDRASEVRVAAAYALAGIGSHDAGVLDGMLQAVIAVDESEPIQPTTQALAYAIGYQQSYTAPLYFDGILATTPETEDPLANVDRQRLYAAVRKLAKNNNARVRSTGVAALLYYNRRDVAYNAQLVTDLIDDSPRGHVMFRDSARAVAIDTLARHNLADGIDYAIDRLDFGFWGAYARYPHRFQVLKRYGGLAKAKLTTLKELRLRVTGGDSREALEAAIAAIEVAAERQERTSLLDLVAYQLRIELKDLSSNGKRGRRCRELQGQFADDGYWQAAILQELARCQKLRQEDLLAAFSHSNAVTRRTAVELAPRHLGSAGKRQLLEQLPSAEPRVQESIIQLLPALEKTEVANFYLSADDDGVRAAAVEVLNQRLGPAQLLAMLKEAPGPETTTAILSVLANHPDCDLAMLTAAMADPEQPDRRRLAKLIAQRPEVGAVETLLGLLQNADAKLRAAAMEALSARLDPALDQRLLGTLAAEPDPKDRSRNQLAGLLLQRRVCETLAPELRARALELLLAETDVGTGRRLIGELLWLPPKEALGFLSTYLERTERSDGDLAKRAASAIRELGERHDAASYPMIAAAIARLDAESK